MHSLLGLYCTKNRKRVLSDSLCMEEDWVYNSPFLFILIFFPFFAGFFSSGSRFYVF